MTGYSSPAECVVSASLVIQKGIERGLSSGHLCFYLGKLQFCKRDHTARRHTIFIVLTKGHVRNGLNSKEWSSLQTKLWNVFKELI